MRNKKLFGFTLAEVLITLAIIGVVAALTLPTLYNNWLDKYFKTKWKKEYALISNAYKMGQLEPKTMPTTPYYVNHNDSAKKAIDVYYSIFSNLNAEAYCIPGVTVDKQLCDDLDIGLKYKYGLRHHTHTVKSLNGDMEHAGMYNASLGMALLKDGTILYAHGALWYYPDIVVDVNGLKEPNVVGRDVFIVGVRNNQVYPGGHPKIPFLGCNKTVQSPSGSYDAERFAGSGCGYKYLNE